MKLKLFPMLCWHFPERFTTWGWNTTAGILCAIFFSFFCGYKPFYWLYEAATDRPSDTLHQTSLWGSRVPVKILLLASNNWDMFSFALHTTKYYTAVHIIRNFCVQWLIHSYARLAVSVIQSSLVGNSFVEMSFFLNGKVICSCYSYLLTFLVGQDLDLELLVPL